MVITRIQVGVDEHVVYGCMTTDGETKWFTEYELEPDEDVKTPLGFTLDIEQDERA